MLNRLLMRNYKIVGITKDEIEMWKDHLRDDIPMHILESRTGRVQIRLSLGIVDAIRLYIDLYKYNKTHFNELYLEKA